MSIAQLHRSTAHPPCPEDREILEIPIPADRAELALTDRLSLRIGLWLLTRPRRPRPAPRRTMTDDEARRLFETRSTTERESLMLLAYHAQRQLY